MATKFAGFASVNGSVICSHERLTFLIHLIYVPTERYLAEKVAEAIQNQIGHICSFAPIGLKALSEKWKSNVKVDMEASNAICLIMTEQSYEDESVIWRIEQALKLDAPLIPISWHYSPVPSPNEINPRIRELGLINYLDVSKEHEDNNLARLSSALEGILPKKINYNCFLSYSRKDTDFTVKLAQDLRNQNLKTWRDAENIPAGANWDREIQTAINECTHVLLVASTNSVDSENVLDEIGLAVNKGKTVIPLMIETCELPLRVHRAQWVDFRENYDSALNKLLEQLGVN